MPETHSPHHLNGDSTHPEAQAAPSNYKVDYEEIDSDGSGFLEVVHPGVGEIYGSISPIPRTVGDKKVYIEMFTADTPGKGFGSVLVREYADEGARRGATHIGGNFISPQALHAYLKSVDPDTLKIANKLGNRLMPGVTIDEVKAEPTQYTVWGRIKENPEVS